jgi:2-amino-4-hydroxy-6-hydroxymethyldihydropteridine diphosphokinase
MINIIPNATKLPSMAAKRFRKNFTLLQFLFERKDNQSDFVLLILPPDMRQKETIYISLGSNLGHKKLHLQQAIFQIGKDLGEVVSISSLYRSPSWGFEGADFLNACISVETQKSAREAMDILMRIEKTMGRKRAAVPGYTNRSIDLDIVYYGHEIIHVERLEIPHPRMQERKFVLKPLADIAPQFYHPILNKDTRNLLQECRDHTNPIKEAGQLFLNQNALFTHLGFLTIEGNIGAGKTSLATKIASDFNAKAILERFADNPFLPNFYADRTRFAFPLEMSFLADRYQQFVEDSNQLDLFKDFMVSDYDINKSLIFAKITLQKQEFELYRKIFGFMYKETKKPAIYVYLYQTTARLLDNIKKRGRLYEQSIDKSYLEDINKGYLEYLRTYPKDNQLIIDVSELDFVNVMGDYETLLTRINSHALEHFN